MPYSADENRQDVLDFVVSSDIKTVLDIGAGSGTYGTLLSEYVDEIHAVEIWEPYVERFGLKDIYDSVQVDDIRNWTDYTITGHKWDLIIFGDVLEHMTAEDSKKIWTYASYIANYGLISVPIVHYPQGAEFGNPYEEHVQDHMHCNDIRRDYGPFVFDKEYEVTGTFIRKFV